MSIDSPSGIPDDHFLFYAPVLDKDTAVLDASESRHLCSVLRKKENDSLQLTDGKGCRARAVITKCSSTDAVVTITSREFPRTAADSLTLMVGLPERDAFESILSDATALGVGKIIPLIAEYCQKPWWSYNWEKSLVRFHLKMVTALKQSKNVLLPSLEQPCKISKLRLPLFESAFLADTEGEPVADALSAMNAAHETLIAVGPPGGFSNSEVEQLCSQGFRKIRIAPHRLRTELASTVACAQIIGMLYGKMRTL